MIRVRFDRLAATLAALVLVPLAFPETAAAQAHSRDGRAGAERSGQAALALAPGAVPVSRLIGGGVIGGAAGVVIGGGIGALYGGANPLYE